MLSVAAAVPVLVLIAVMAKPLIRIWAGPEAVPHTSLILWLSLYNLLGVLLMGGAQLLIGLERLAPLVLSVTLCALGTIGLGILFGRSIGLSGVAMAMAVSKLAFLFPIQIWAVRRLLTTKRVDPAKVAGEAAV
jgi:O-antigen/teichoic acid export membrane protein